MTQLMIAVPKTDISSQIPYYLEEENNWSLNIGEMKKAIDEARPHCKPRGLVLINPGNPKKPVFSFSRIKTTERKISTKKNIQMEGMEKNIWLEVTMYGLSAARSVRHDREPNIYPSSLTKVSQ